MNKEYDSDFSEISSDEEFITNNLEYIHQNINYKNLYITDKNKTKELKKSKSFDNLNKLEIKNYNIIDKFLNDEISLSNKNLFLKSLKINLVKYNIIDSIENYSEIDLLLLLSNCFFLNKCYFLDSLILDILDDLNNSKKRKIELNDINFQSFKI